MQVLTLSRIAKSNAYTQSLLLALEDAILHADTDREVQIIAVTGAGDRVFCAGADREEIADRDWRDVVHLTAARVFARLAECRCVTIAAINGDAVGGGFELALHCDLRIACRGGRFWLPEPELGLLPAAGALRRLPRAVGPYRALDLIVGGARWTAADAWQAGLVSELAEPQNLWSRVHAWAERLSRRDEVALQWAKRLILAASVAANDGVDRMAQATLARQRVAER